MTVFNAFQKRSEKIVVAKDRKEAEEISPGKTLYHTGWAAGGTMQAFRIDNLDDGLIGSVRAKTLEQAQESFPGAVVMHAHDYKGHIECTCGFSDQGYTGPALRGYRIRVVDEFGQHSLWFASLELACCGRPNAVVYHITDNGSVRA